MTEQPVGLVDLRIVGNGGADRDAQFVIEQALADGDVHVVGLAGRMCGLSAADIHIHDIS